MSSKAPVCISVETPFNYVDQSSADRGISMITHLFRQGTCLPEVLQQAYERNGDSTDLTVVSAGCSIGAELDSVLALHAKSEHGGSLKARGYDINPLAIRHARRGLYRVNGSYSPEEMPPIQATLDEYGFASSVIALSPESHTFGAVRALEVEAAPVRSGQDVAFGPHDIREDPPQDELVDLALVNNVLYHLQPSEALRVVVNLASILSDQGVLSLNNLRRNPNRLMKPEGGRTLRFVNWLPQLIDHMEKKFDLRPLSLSEEVDSSVTIFAH